VSASTRDDDAAPLIVGGIMDFRDGKVVRERTDFGEPWERPAWRARGVQRLASGAREATR